MSYAKRQMFEALDALALAAEAEGYPFEGMDDDLSREALERDDCGAPSCEGIGDCVECGAPGMKGRCSRVDRKEAH
jgi:hypothetical protein